MSRRVLCFVSQHKISPRRVWHDGLDFRSRCQRCGASVIRLEQGWATFDPARDGRPDRLENRRTGTDAE